MKKLILLSAILISQFAIAQVPNIQGVWESEKMTSISDESITRFTVKYSFIPEDTGSILSGSFEETTNAQEESSQSELSGIVYSHTVLKGSYEIREGQILLKYDENQIEYVIDDIKIETGGIDLNAKIVASVFKKKLIKDSEKIMKFKAKQQIVADEGKWRNLSFPDEDTFQMELFTEANKLVVAHRIKVDER